jgi:aldose 1-epimerase
LIDRERFAPYDWRSEGPVATLSSEWSGIQLDIFTDQDAFQVYSCNTMNGKMPFKKDQGDNGTESPRTIPRYGCLVMEVQDWIDGINHAEWMRDRKQFFEPGGSPYILQATYSFNIKK